MHYRLSLQQLVIIIIEKNTPFLLFRNEERLQPAACPHSDLLSNDPPEDGVDLHWKRPTKEIQAEPDNKGGDEATASAGVEKKCWF